MILQNSNIKEEDFPNDNFASLAEQFEFAPNNILETRLQEFPKAITIHREKQGLSNFLYVNIVVTIVLNLFSVWQFSVF